MKKILAILPARYASTRFPAKPLAVLGNKPVVMWAYDTAANSGLFDKVCVATDDSRIMDAVAKYGGKAIMTSDTLRCGTERCEQALSVLESQGESYDYVVNIQGDEPLISKEQIAKVCEGFEEENADIVTLKKLLENADDVRDRNIVKVVCGANEKALYFSRSVIPFNRDRDLETEISEGRYYKHIGIYGYRADVLHRITRLKATVLEKTESLEQLRWLENGYNIIVKTTDRDTVGVDTPEDLERIKNILNK